MIDIDIQISKALEKKLEALKNPIDKPTAELIGKEVTKEMKRLISQGNSPIRGKGKFPGYRKPDVYPGDRKSKSPVNLKLTGDFLKDLSYESVKQQKDYAAEISYRSSESNDKERGHREGANRQPKRPTLPQGKEQFAESVKSAYIKIIQDRIDKLVRG